MPTASFRRTTLLLLLVAVLASPWPSAAGPRAEEPRPARAAEPAAMDFFDRVWSFLESMWSKSGCDVNPNSVCDTDTAQPPQAKEGCHINPNGGCTP